MSLNSGAFKVKLNLFFPARALSLAPSPQAQRRCARARAGKRTDRQTELVQLSLCGGPKANTDRQTDRQIGELSQTETETAGPLPPSSADCSTGYLVSLSL